MSVNNLDDFFNAKPVVVEPQQTQITEFRPNHKKGQNGVYKAVVRFLPNPVDPANKSIISKNTVYLTNPVSKVGKTIDCPSTVGEPDPLQNTFFALRNAQNPVLQENSKQFSRKQQYASIVQVLQCESEPALVGKILVWRYGMKIHEKLQAEMNPPMGSPRNPFNLFTGRPFSVQVKEVGGFPNYDGCGFFDLDINQSGMRIITNNAQGQPQTYVVTEDTIKTPEGKQMVFNYLKENAPDMSKYEYHPWDAETTQFVNECITIYSDPQKTIQAMSTTTVPGMTQVGQAPMQAQAAAAVMPQMPQMPQVAPQMPQTFTAPSAQMPIEIPQMNQAMPTMGPSLNPQVGQVQQTVELPADLENLLNGGATAKPSNNPQPMLDLENVML